jgi:hypothetical protein
LVARFFKGGARPLFALSTVEGRRAFDFVRQKRRTLRISPVTDKNISLVHTATIKKSSDEFSGQGHHKQHQKNPAQSSFDHRQSSEFERSFVSYSYEKVLFWVTPRDYSNYKSLKAEIEGISPFLFEISTDRPMSP